MLISGKFVEIKTRIKNVTLISVGTQSDGSCFFHALFTCIIPDFLNWDADEQRKYVYEARCIISDRLKIKHWINLCGGNLANVIITSVLQKLYTLPETIDNKEKKKLDDVFNHLVSKYSVKNMNFGVHIHTAAKSWQAIVGGSVEFYEDYFRQLFIKAQEISWIKYKDKMRNKRCWIDDTQIFLLSKMFGKDIYILDANNGYKTIISTYSNKKSRDIICISNIDNSHYESIYWKIGETTHRVLPAHHKLRKMLETKQKMI